MLMGFRQCDGITHTFLGLVVGNGVDQIKERWARRHPLGHFNTHNFCPNMQVEEDNAVHTVVLQDPRLTGEDRRTLAWLEQVLEQPPVTDPFDLRAREPWQVSIGTTITMRRRLWTEANA
jgi:hypothetical protein